MKPEEFLKKISRLISDKKTLAVNASPRTAGICRSIASRINKNIAASSVIDLSNFTILPCLGCLKCAGGECVRRDDFPYLIARIKEAEFLILISPVFFAGLPAQLKAVIDRCQFYWSNKIKPFKKCSGFFILTGQQDKDYLSCCSKPVKAFFKTLGIKYEGDIYVRNEKENLR